MRAGQTLPHVWATIDATNMAVMQDDGGEEVDVCASCCQKHTITFCGEYAEIVLNVLIYTSVGTELFMKHNKRDMYTTYANTKHLVLYCTKRDTRNTSQHYFIHLR